MALGEFLPLAAVHFLAVVSPGPDLAVTMKSSLAGGRGAGIRTALGISAGNSIHVCYTLIGIGLLLQSSPTVFLVVSLIGAAYLAYLGANMLRSAFATWRGDRPMPHEAATTTAEADPSSSKRPFLMGFLTNATNRKTTLFFVAVFNSLVSTSTPWLQKLGYGVWMCGVSAAWFALVAAVLSRTGLRQRYYQVQHWIDAALGALLLALAVSIAIR